MRAVAIVLPLILAACAGGAADKAGPDSSGQTGDTDPGGADDTDSEASDDTDSEASDDTDSEASDDTDAPPAPGTVRGDQAVHGTDDAEALAGVTVIEGALDLTCYGAADLSALAGLTEVTGDLTLDCPDLDDLSALSALTRVGGTLSVRRAPRSRNLTGLGALASIGRDLTLCAPYGRGSVTSPRGVGALASIGGQLDVDTCAEVVDLDGLTALRTLGSARVAFSGVRSIAGLAGVTSIAGDVDLISLPLGSLDGLAVTTIGGTLHLSELSSLRDLDPLAGLTEVGGLDVFNCYNLYDLTGLEALTAVHGGVTLQANAQLIDLRGVESLRTIEGDLRVLSNPTMRSLDGLYIGDLGGALWIQDNGILDPDAPIIAGVIGGDVTLSADRMSTLRLLGEVTSIGGTLSTNEPITSTEALAVLEEVGGDVSFRDASTLVTLSFPALRSIGGSLRHTLRDRIATVSAPRLESVGGDLLLHVPGPYGYLPVPTTVTLDALRTVGGALDLWVTTFKDGGVSIPVLEEVGGDVTLDSNVARDHIDVLDGVVRIGGSFTLDARYTGTTAALTEVGGDLTIASDADTRAAMRAVTRVGGALIIDSVPDVSGSLRALTEVGALDVEPGAGFSIGTFSGLRALRVVHGDAVLRGNQAGDGFTTRYDALDALTTIEGALTLEDDLYVPVLVDLTDVRGSLTMLRTRIDYGEAPMLRRLTHVRGDLTVSLYHGPADFRYVDLEGVDWTDQVLPAVVEVDGDLLFNARVPDRTTALYGLPALTTVHGDVQVVSSTIGAYGYAVPTMDALRALTTIDGDLTVDATTYTSLPGLGSLTSTHYMNVTNNPNLNDISGLHGLRTVSGMPRFTGNPNLCLDDRRDFERTTGLTADWRNNGGC